MKKSKFKDKSTRVRQDLYVGSFMGSYNGGKLKHWISISDDKEPGVGEWLSEMEAVRLVNALAKHINRIKYDKLEKE